MSFRLDSAPRDEMDDHKHYFDLAGPVADAGLRRLLAEPIRCRPYKLATCTFGRARKDQEAPYERRRLRRHLPDRDHRADRGARPRRDRGARRRARAVRERGGRLFILGVGGSAGHASTPSTTSASSAGSRPTRPPTMSPSSPRAPTTRAGRPSFEQWLSGSRLGAGDGLLVFSVGGGDAEADVSANLVRALDLAAERRRRASSASSAATAATPRRWPTACVVVPPLYRRRGSRRTPRGWRGGLAPAGQPSRLQRAATKWESHVGDRRSVSACRHRRRRRLHRQPLRRRAARRAGPTERHPLRQLLLRPASGTSPHHAGDARLRGRARRRPGPRRARARRWRATTSSSTSPPTPTSRAAMTEPDDRLRRGHPAHPQRARGDAAGRVAAIALRLGQRRLRRPRRARGRRGPRPAASRLDLRREQARRRGA